MGKKVNCELDIKASFTVEAALIFPIIFLILIFIIQILFIFYEKVNLSSLAYETTESAKVLYNLDSVSDEYVIAMLKEDLQCGQDIESEVNIQNSIINKYLLVNLSKEYSTLFGEVTIKARSKIHLINQYDTIQSTDFLTDVIEDIPQLREYKQKYYEKLDMIKNKLQHILE